MKSNRLKFRLIVLFGCLLLLSQVVKAQLPERPNALNAKGEREGEWIVLYDSALMNEVQSLDSMETYLLVRYKAGKPVGMTEGFLKNGILTFKGYLFSIEPTIRHGLATHYYPNGNILEEVVYRYDSLDGPIKMYHENGIIRAIGSAKRGALDGYFEFYYDNGQLELKGTIVKGNYEGIWERFNPNGSLRSRGMYVNDLDQGYWEYYYDDGVMESKGQLVDGKKEGRWLFYHRNGKLNQDAVYKEGERQGPYKWYYESGSIEQEGPMKAGKENGLFSYYHENGQVDSRGVKKNGEFEGEWKHYHPNGQLRAIGIYINGSKTGQWKFYDEEGKLSTVSELSDDVWNGLATNYYSNGRVKSQGNYLDDLKDGEWKFYNEEGQLTQRSFHKKDQRHGTMELYLDDGTLAAKGDYKEDLMDGDWVYHYTDGTTTIGTYKSELQHGYFKRYGANGEMSEEGNYIEDKRDGLWKYYYDSGSLKSEGNYVDGEKSGGWIYYNDDGSVYAKGKYENDLTVGNWQYFHSNGEVVKEGEEYADNANGLWKYYEESGLLTYTGNWRYGKKHGKWVTFDEQGKITEELHFNYDKQLNFSTYYDSIYRLVDSKRMDMVWQVFEKVKESYKAEYGPGIRYAEVLEVKSYIERKEGKYKKALKTMDQALNHILKYKQDTSKWYLLTLPYKGYIFNDMNDYASSSSVFRQLVDLTRQRPDWMNLSNYYYDVTSLANALRFNGQLEEAGAMIDQEMEIAKQHSAPFKNIAGMYVEIVNVAENSNDDEWLFQVLNQGLKYVQENELSVHWTNPYLNYKKGLFFGNRSMRDSANVYFLKSYDAYQAIGDTTNWTYVNTLLRLGDYYYGFSDYTHSRPYYENAVRRAIEGELQQHWVYNYAINNLAKQYLAEGRDKESLELYEIFVENELNSAEPSKAYLSEGYLGMALTLQGLGSENYSKVEKYYQEAMNVYNGEDKYQDDYLNAGLIYGQFLSMRAERYNDSDKLLREMLQYINRFPNTDQDYLATNYQYLGDNFYRINQTDSAKYYYDLAIKTVGDRIQLNVKTLQEIYAKMAGIYEDLDDNVTAQSYNFKALELVDKYLGKNNLAYISRLRDIGTNFTLQGNYTTAIEYLNRSASAFDAFFGEQNTYSLWVRLHLAESLRDNDQVIESIELLLKVKEGFESIDQTGNTGYVRCYSELGESYESNKQIDLSDKYYQELPKLAKQVIGENSSQYARYIRHVGLYYSRQNRNDEAYVFLKDAIDKIEPKYGKNIYYAWYAESLRNVQMAREKYVEAIAYGEEAIEIYRVMDSNSEDYRNAIYSVAEVYRNMGRYQEAIDKYQQVVSKIVESQGSFSYVITHPLKEISTTYWRWKKPKEALHYQERVENLFDSLGVYRWNYADLYNMKGLIYYEMGDNIRSREYHQKAIDISDSLWGEKNNSSQLYRNNIAFTYMHEGDFEKAEELWLGAGEVFNAPAQGDLTRVRWLDNMAALYLSWNRLDKAEPYWNEVTDILLKRVTGDFAYLSESGKAAFWDANKENFEYFNTYGIKAAAKGKSEATGKMYDNQLLTKGILLSTSTKERRKILNSGDSTLVDNYFTYISLKEQLAKYYGYTKEKIVSEKVDISGLEQQAARLEKVLSLDAEGLGSEEKAKAIRWKNIQRGLKPGEAAIEIVRFRYFDKKVTDSVMYAALILTPETKNAPRLVVINNGSALENKHVKAYKSSIQFKLRDDRSYQQFWKAIDQELKGVNRVFISPDGVFNQISIGTLLKPDGTYVRDAYEMKLLSSTRDLLLVKREAPANRTAYLFGFPKYDLAHSDIETMLEERGISSNGSIERAIDLERFGFNELPGTKTETEEITKILEGKNWQTNLYLSDKALEEDLKAISNPSVLHIATHGFFLDDVTKVGGNLELGVRADVSRENPLLRSGLLLTGAAQTARGEINNGIENGIFTAYEAMNLNLQNTDLVVLSACETGRGEIKNGEGVYGLQRAFQIAGADAIIMSLWKVDDNATQLLMTEFYKAWTDGMGKVQALKIAQDKVRAQYDHPYYWGAFVLVGS